MITCKCGCGKTFDESKGYYNIPYVGAVSAECYDRIVPQTHRGSFYASVIIQNYVKKNLDKSK